MDNQSIMLEAREVLMQLVETINQLNYDEYIQKIELLSNSSVGEHTRHIIELFQQLILGYETGGLDYDKRKRNTEIQINIDYAIECIATIISSLEKGDKIISLTTLYNDDETIIQTTYFRELMYNIEHCVHHQAIIKTALLCLGKTQINVNLGVAKSTIIYRKECAQ